MKRTQVVLVTHQQLQFSLVEYLDRVERHQLVEAALEGLHLILDPCHEPPVDDRLDVLLLVLVGHLDLGAPGPQLSRYRRPELLLVNL